LLTVTILSAVRIKDRTGYELCVYVYANPSLWRDYTPGRGNIVPAKESSFKDAIFNESASTVSHRGHVAKHLFLVFNLEYFCLVI